MNPFAAPEHDSPVPSVGIGQRLLTALGIFEMISGTGLALLFMYVLWEDLMAEQRHIAQSLGATAVAFLFLLGLCGLCVVAGYKLTRRTSWKPLLLQIGPAVLAVLFVLFGVLGG